MFTVTDSAAGHLAHLLDEAEAPDGVVARLVATQEGLQIGMDHARPDDRAFEQDGRTVLVLDNDTFDMLDQRTLELEESDEGLALTIR